LWHYQDPTVKHKKGLDMLKRTPTTEPLNPFASYQLGPLHPSLLSWSMIFLSDGSVGHFLYPDESLLPVGLLTDLRFLNGVVIGLEYSLFCLDDLLSNFAFLANRIFDSLGWDLRRGDYAEAVGYLLGTLSVLAEEEFEAEEDYLMASVGVHHLCYLVSLISIIPPVSGWQLGQALDKVRCANKRVVCAYCARLRSLRQAGMHGPEVQRLALHGYIPEPLEAKVSEGLAS
jgi:hypothetical protein